MPEPFSDNPDELEYQDLPLPSSDVIRGPSNGIAASPITPQERVPLRGPQTPEEHVQWIMGTHPVQLQAVKKITDAISPKPAAVSAPAAPAVRGPIAMPSDMPAAPIFGPPAPEESAPKAQAEPFSGSDEPVTPDVNALGSKPVSDLPPIGSAAPPRLLLPTQREKDQNELTRLETTGSGVHQIHNPFLRGAAKAGEIAASVFGFQPTLASIPGTDQHHQVLVNQARGAVAGDVANEKGVADTAHTQAETEVLKNKPDSPQDKAIHTYTNADGKETTIFQTPDNKTYEKTFGASASKPIKEGEMPLGDKVPQLNAMLTSRRQVLNPGQPLGSQYTLPTNATQKDYDRIDKALESEERAKGTEAQRETANAMRQQTFALAQSAALDRQANATDRQERQGHDPVVGIDPKTGQQVLVPSSEANKLGLTSVMKADADLVNKSHAARTWLQLADKKTPEGAPSDEMGILQLVDKMDKAGKLGPIASRWNDFLAGKVGEGDPDYAALRAKMGLSSTKLMQAHVGSRGGAFMLEHFEDLANAGKMDAPTLKAGIKSELNYMKDVAMSPEHASTASTGATHIVNDANGHRIGTVVNGKYQPDK